MFTTALYDTFYYGLGTMHQIYQVFSGDIR